jgi:hypothetical protein
MVRGVERCGTIVLLLSAAHKTTQNTTAFLHRLPSA